MNEKEFLIVKVGDKEKGWIPAQATFTEFLRVAEESKLTENFKVLIVPYFFEFEAIGKASLEDYGIQIIDEEKFLQRCGVKVILPDNTYIAIDDDSEKEDVKEE